MVNITVLQLMNMLEKDESIRNYQSRWRELRSLLEKQAEVASQQERALDLPLASGTSTASKNMFVRQEVRTDGAANQ